MRERNRMGPGCRLTKSRFRCVVTFGYLCLAIFRAMCKRSSRFASFMRPSNRRNCSRSLASFLDLPQAISSAVLRFRRWESFGGSSPS